jgi:hypothetical protein
MRPVHFWICKFGTVPGSMTCVERKFELKGLKCKWEEYKGISCKKNFLRKNCKKIEKKNDLVL